MKLFTLKRFFVVTLLMCLGVSQGWGHDTHYGKVTVTSNGNGTVYIGTSNTATTGNTTETWDCGGNSGSDSKTYYLFAKPDDGYKFKEWSGSGSSKSNPYQIKPKADSKKSGSPSTFNYIATFEWINNFKATVKVEAGVYENNEYRKVEGFPISVDGKNSENTQEYNERPESEKEKKFDFILRADDTEDYVFIGWAETTEGTPALIKESPYTAEVTCYATNDETPHDHSVEKTWYAIYKKKNTFKATVTVKTACDGEEGEFGTVSVTSKNPQDWKELDAPNHEFTFSVNAVNNQDDDYEFLGWSEDINATDFTLENTSASREWTGYKVNCDANTEVTPILYAIYKKKNTFKATLSVKTACGGEEGEFGTVSVTSTNPQTWKELDAASHEFTFAVKAENNPDDDYEFLGWSEDINATSFTSENTSASRSWNGYKVTCNANSEVTPTLYAIYKLKNTFKATVSVKTACGGEEGDFGTVSVTSTNPQTWKELDAASHEFTFAVKAENNPDDDYEFLGWSEDINAISFTSENTSASRSWNGYKVTCNANSEVTPTLYAIYTLKNTFGATVTVKTACDGVEGEFGVVSVPKGNTQTAKELAPSHEFTFSVTAEKDNEHYEFQGWSENKSATEFPETETSSSASTWNGYKVTCNANATVETTLYAIYKHKILHTATIKAYSVGEGTVGEGGTVTVDGKPNTDTQTSYKVDDQTFAFTLKATPAQGYQFLGWAESEDGEIISENNELSQTVTCTAIDNTFENSFYAIFGTKMAIKKETDAYLLKNSKPEDGVPFIILDSSSNVAMAPTASNYEHVGDNVEVSLENNGAYYVGGANTSELPKEFYFEDGKYIYYWDGNTKRYLYAEQTGGVWVWNWDARLNTTTDLASQADSYKEFTCTPSSDGKSVEITIRPIDAVGGLIGSTFWLEYNGSKFNLVKNGDKKTVRLFEFEANSVGDDLTETIAVGTQEGYGTFYNADNAYMMPEGLTGSVIIDPKKEGTLNIVPVYSAGDIVPAGTPLLIEGNKGSYPAKLYKKTRKEADAVATYPGNLKNNHLEGTRVQHDGAWWTATANEYDVYYYKLSYSDSTGKLGFYWGNQTGGPFTLSKTYTAYLTVSQTSEARGFALTDIEEEETVIEDVVVKNENEAIYTVSGMRMNDTENLPAGIYIRNGKKFIVR